MNKNRIIVPLARLQLNTKNARHGELPSQRDCIQWMLTNLTEEICALAKDISVNGLSPLEGMLVLPAEDPPNEYVAWEGNRRITALKLLADPSRCEDKNLARRFTELRNKASHLPDEIEVTVASSVEEANRLIALRHQGKQGGIGVIEWDPTQKDRHLAGMGRRGRYTFTQEVIDSFINRLDSDLREKIEASKFSISTVDRLLKNPAVREFLGLSSEDGDPRRRLPETEIVKGLSKILRDSASGNLPVKEVYTAEQQRDYIKKFSPEDTPDQSRLLKDSKPLTQATAAPPVVNKTRSLPASNRRKYLIPYGTTYAIKHGRLNDIYIELRTKLEVERCKNATAVLFRVFIELATDLLLDQHNLPNHPKDSLKTKVGRALDHAEANNWLERKAANRIRTQFDHPTSLFGCDALHSYVHSTSFNPIPSELNTHWERIEPYFNAILPRLA